METRKQFLSDLLDAAVSGVQYWANVTLYSVSSGFINLEDDGGNPHTVTTQTLSHGIAIARRVGLLGDQDYIKQWWEADRTNGEDGDYDSDIADQIVQLGLFGKIVYG